MSPWKFRDSFVEAQCRDEKENEALVDEKGSDLGMDVDRVKTEENDLYFYFLKTAEVTLTCIKYLLAAFLCFFG